MRILISFLITLFVAAAGSFGARAQDMELVMDGARYWSQNCTRCHNARSPLERTDREWVTIVQHMRARGNLTRTEAVAVSAFLKSSNGIPSNDAPSNESESPESPVSDNIPPSSDAQDGSRTSTDRAESPLNQADRMGTSPEQVEPYELRQVRAFLQEW
ncbi:MAG: hypothetical protein WD423_06830 [Rhodothermales bacterium]